MTQIEIQAPTQNVPRGYKVDVSRGQRIGRVSSEWFSRPADERYLSLTDLHDAVKTRSERSRTRVVQTEAIRVEASRNDAERLSLIIPGRTGRSLRRIGVLANWQALSAHRPPICASFRRRLPESICSTG